MENNSEVIDFMEVKQVEQICDNLEANVLKAAREQESYLLRLIESLERRRMPHSESRDLVFYRAKLIGMLDIMDILHIDRTEFNWIFKI